MRSNQNPSGSITRGVGDRSIGARGVGQSNVEQPGIGQSLVAKLSMPQMPVEWLDAGSWRLPSGKALAEFALQAGFLAPLLFRADGFGKSAKKSGTPQSAEMSVSAEMNGAAEVSESTGISRNVGQARGKHFSKGDSR
jgi:hypothetical protein